MTPHRSTAARVAILAATLNLVAAAAMLLVRQGLPGAADAGGRLRYITDHTGLWRVTWLLWHAAAISLVALLVMLAQRWRERTPLLTRLAVVLAGAGLAGDLAAETLMMGAEPGADPHTFAVLERVDLLLTGYLGNGLYSVAGALLTAVGWRSLPRHLRAVSIPTWGAGLSLSVATLVDSSMAEIACSAALMPLFVVWALLAARWLHRDPS